MGWDEDTEALGQAGDLMNLGLVCPKNFSKLNTKKKKKAQKQQNELRMKSMDMNI